MKKRFNITGMCIPEQHFMADMSKKLHQIKEMVVDGDYFTINRPRQYGKTTILYLLEQLLQEDGNYLVLDLSFEGIGSQTYENHQRFIRVFLDQVHRRLKFMKEEQLIRMVEKKKESLDGFEELDTFITEMVLEARRDVVMMIDEVDKAGNNQLFLDFLGMLRKKYLEGKKGKDHTFHSILLAGVHDIKTLKAKIRPENDKMYNSPWNIAVDMDIDISLFPDEIASMLSDYTAERKVSVDISSFAEKLYKYTSGYPFLVSSLCKIIDEKILPRQNRNRWLPDDLTEAMRLLLNENNTNFDTVTKNLENNSDLYEFVYRVIMEGVQFSYNPRNPVIHRGTLYGILRREEEKVCVHNAIYEQLIYDYMSSKLETSGDIDIHLVSSSYIDKNGGLDMEKVIRKFQEFMKAQYSTKDKNFLERNDLVKNDPPLEEIYEN